MGKVMRINGKHADRDASDEWKLRSSVGWNEYFVNEDLTEAKRRSLCKSGNPEGREIPACPRNLGGPQPLLSGAGQGLDFYIGELEIIEVELDFFDHTLRSIEGDPDRLDFRWGLPFNHGRW